MARSIKKGPFIEKKLYKRITESNKAGKKPMIKTYSRTSTIIPEMVGYTISVYNGKTWVPVFVTENLVGHKLWGVLSHSPVPRTRPGSDKKGRR